MTRSLLLAAALFLLFAVPAWADSQGHDDHADTTPAGSEQITNSICPVTTDEAVEPDIFIEYEGERVYFCCKRCRKKFIDDPNAYLSNLPQSASAGDALADDHGEEQAGGHDHGGGQTDDHGNGHDSGGGHADDNGEAHDHAKDHGSVAELSFWDRAVRFAGKFHPLVVHFPIGLLISAVVAEFLATATRIRWLRNASRVLIFLGAPTAIAAAALGWAAALNASYPGELAQILVVHRWLGIATAVVALLTLVVSERYWRQESSRRRVPYLVALGLTAALVGVTGHFGATLIYGTEHFTW